MNEHDHTPISDLTLERFVLEELPAEVQRQISDLLESDDILRRRIEDLRASNKAILEEAPPALTARKIRNRMTGDRSPNTTTASHWWVPAIAVAAALLIFIPGQFQSTDGPESGYTGIKGQTPHLVLYRQVDEKTERLDDGAAAVEGDVIQIVCISPDEGYGVIFSIDGRDSLVLHRAERGVSFKLKTGKPDTLGFSYQLDDAPAYERFYLVTAEQPFYVIPLIKKARQTTDRTLSLPDQYRLDTFTLNKE